VIDLFRLDLSLHEAPLFGEFTDMARWWSAPNYATKPLAWAGVVMPGRLRR